jgi:bifunctional non-homologous end joining protein LigD
MVWTPEPTYAKPDISVRATTLYYQIVAPIMLPFLERRLLNLFRCREGKCFFQRNREHPPTGKEFDDLVHFAPVKQKNGRTEQYLYVESAEEITACAKVQTVEFHGWGSRAGEVETPDRLVIDLDPDPKLSFETIKDAAFQLHRSLDALGLESFALLTGGKGIIHIVVPLMPNGTRCASSPRRSAQRSPRPIQRASPSLCPSRSAAAGSSSISSATSAPQPRSCHFRRGPGPGCPSLFR